MQHLEKSTPKNNKRFDFLADLGVSLFATFIIVLMISLLFVF